MSEIEKSQEVSSWDIVRRWGGKKAIFTDGFLPVPLTFLRNASSLCESGISPAEMLLILELMTFKWDEDAPFPSYSRLGDQMGVSEAYVRKLARSLEEKRLLEREKRKGRTNRFNLEPLFSRLNELGKEIEERKAEKE